MTEGGADAESGVAADPEPDPEPKQPATPQPDPVPPTQQTERTLSQRLVRVGIVVAAVLTFFATLATIFGAVFAFPTFAKDVGWWSTPTANSTGLAGSSGSTGQRSAPDPTGQGSAPDPTGQPSSSGTSSTTSLGNDRPPVGQFNPAQPVQPTRTATPTPTGTTKTVTYITSDKYRFTLRDGETLQFQGTDRPNLGAPGDWGNVIYKDVDHQLNYWHITDTGAVSTGSWSLCHANAKTYDAIHLDGVDLTHAFCRPESVVGGDPQTVSYVRVTDNSHISDSPPTVSVEVWFVTASG
jgi:hypothetical protein